MERERGRIMHSLEIAVRPDLRPDQLFRPEFDVGTEIAKQFSPVPQSLTSIGLGYVKPAVTPIQSFDPPFGDGGTDIVGSLLRQRPQFTRGFETNTLDDSFRVLRET